MRTSSPTPTSACVHPHRGVRAWLTGLALAVATVGWAQPNPILYTSTFACPEATLPIRLAVLQPFGNDVAVDPLQWVAIDEFKATTPAIAPTATDPPIHIVVLAYLAGNPVDVEVLLTPFGAPEPTWRRTITPELPTIARGMHLFPYYLAAEVPRTDYGRAFPVDGPYHLVARPARDPQSAYVDGFCMAEAATWVFVARR